MAIEEINAAEVVAEVQGLFERYESALMANDVVAIDSFFWRHRSTVRFGLAENLYGFDAISAFRRSRPRGRRERTLENTIITTYGSDAATTNTEFRLPEGRTGRQSQTWIRLPEGWRIVAAHVSWHEPVSGSGA